MPFYATGRKPNVEPLQLKNTDIELTERGAIKSRQTRKQTFLASLQLGMSTVDFNLPHFT